MAAAAALALMTMAAAVLAAAGDKMRGQAAVGPSNPADLCSCVKKPPLSSSTILQA